MVKEQVDTHIGLKEVDRVEITCLMDNYVDVLLGGTEIARRPPISDADEIPKDSFQAEHGLSLLVKVESGRESHTTLLDTGHSETGIFQNMEKLHVDADSIETIIISHAHMDHNGALQPLLEKMSTKPSIIVHPYAFQSSRFIKNPEGKKRYFPMVLIKGELTKSNAELVVSDVPTLTANDMIAVTGEVERITDFEKGMPNAFVEIDGKEEHDSIKDDQAIVVNLKGRGLVVISGCSHAGIINTILFAKKITGVEKVYGVFGGFHLTGQLPEYILEMTLDEMKRLDPGVVVPMHCTGWNSVKRIEAEFPNAFILNSVGTTYILTH